MSTAVWFKVFYLFLSKSVAFRLNYACLTKSLSSFSLCSDCCVTWDECV